MCENQGPVGAEGERNGEGVPLPNLLGGLGSVVSSPSGVLGGAPVETNLVHFVAAGMTLIAIIRIIVSAIMDIETHTAKHEQQNVTMFTYTHHIQGHSFKR